MRSYEIVPGAVAEYPGRGRTGHDPYVTRYDRQREVRRARPRLRRRPSGVPVRRVSGQPPKHPIVWKYAGSRHLTGDEERQPPAARGQGLPGRPGDVTVVNPLTPGEPVRRNGYGRPRS
ncbi:copper amine oxidase [Streptomyces zinciresistens K42]|uniref:Copper amine oxidase n=1 Tax=Streptomyces zinciresistens K42 TaxID=700597 RepID=G2GL94_9ACTN|nr:copper amine oxidase [Streptomyces zinciresistens K42]